MLSMTNRIKNTIIFLPLLILYVSIILTASTDEFFGDEGRYIMYANNLVKGHYSPLDRVYLWNGPGYPIFLMPFIIFKLPLITAKLFNAVFLLFAIIYFYYTLRLYMKKRPALFFSYLLGLYPLFMRYIHMLLTEQIAIFLICGFAFHFCKLHRDNKKSKTHLIISSFYLGYLALTKIIFGYVILIGLILFLFLYVWKKRNAFKNTFLFYLIAMICCMPYLIYTYSLTEKVFYWGNSGGLVLYLMSTPYQNEFGDYAIHYEKHHQDYFKELNDMKLSSIQKDDALKKKAIENIIDHPGKYIMNLMANIGRLLFNYPQSYTPQKMSSYFNIIPNMFLMVFCIICIYPTYASRKLIPFEIYALILFAAIVFVGLVPLNSEVRYFLPLIPILMLWISFIFTRVLKLEIQRS